MTKIYVLYAVIILFANIFGAIAGMGGGVIIKPLFDAIGAHTLIAINFYSSIAVLTMSVASTLRQAKTTQPPATKMLLSLGVGSLLGGWLGDKTLNALLSILGSDQPVRTIQILMTIISLLFAIIYSYKPFFQFRFRSALALILVALFLGWLATLLGIGGGPINVAVLMAVCGFQIKSATAYSLLTILFSQAAKITTTIVTDELWQFDLRLLWVIIPAAAIGGTLGTLISQRVKAKQVELIYRLAIITVICLNLGNAFGI